MGDIPKHKYLVPLGIMWTYRSKILKFGIRIKFKSTEWYVYYYYLMSVKAVSSAIPEFEYAPPNFEPV